VTNTRSLCKNICSTPARKGHGLPFAAVAGSRYRCTACGNLTRFDVTSTRTTRAFHHFTVGGDLSIEEEQVLAEVVEDVACRWCGSGRDVEVLSPSEAGGS
jgi:hypothetical protein